MGKDPVCKMIVDEKKAQYISEVNGQKIYLIRTQANMDTESSE
jgi:YHS domain-containing protein